MEFKIDPRRPCFIPPEPGRLLKWRCEACADWRLDEDITVVKGDVSQQLALPAGTVERSVKHCVDREACQMKALGLLQTFGVKPAGSARPTSPAGTQSPSDGSVTSGSPGPGNGPPGRSPRGNAGSSGTG